MNTNMMDVDPLSSYGQYNTYQPPQILPQTSDSHPQSSAPHVQSNPPHAQSNLPHAQSSAPHSQTNLSHVQSSAPHAQSNLPHAQSSAPHAQSNLPHAQSSAPHAQTSLPHSQPGISHPQPDIPNIQPPTQPIPDAQPGVSHTQSYNKDYYPQHSVFNENTPFNVNQILSNTVDYINRQLQPSYTNGQTEAPLNEEEVDIKPDITKIKIKRTRKLKGKTSSYWNKKITDKDFKFYGCSVCNISFNELSELDSHVTIHNDRITSYDIRIQNLKKRKRLRKEKKKKKKDAKVKKEFEIEIKPEEGYIGTEKAEDFKDVKKDIVDNVKKAVKVANGKNEVYKCFACNKQFALSYYLKIHVRSHTDEKPYVCNYCGQTFITASKLGRHNKRIHLAIRHQCRICYSFFSRFELLTKHFDKKHADQKLEGEPYDYNAILPYLTELEEQFKMEAEAKKPKTEDPWDWPLTTPQAPEQPKVEKQEDEKLILPTKFEFADDATEKVEIQIKCELEEEEPMIELNLEPLPDFQVFDQTFETQPSSDDEVDLVKEEKPPVTDDEEEYFPPGGWARSPPRQGSPPPASPPAMRKGGVGVCQLCNRTFSSKSYLKVHMRTHTGEKPFSCYVCGRGFITASKMHRHVLTHDETWVGENCIKPEEADIKTEADDGETNKEKELEKSKTNIEKAKVKLLKKPNKRMDPELKKGRGRPHCCEYCFKKFLHIETLQVHQKSHEGEALIIRCAFCLEPQLDHKAKDEHEATHTGPKPYLCTLCGRHYKDRGAMVYHRKNHKPSDEKLFICDICSKRFHSQAKLARHIVTHSNEKFVLRYECPVCANMFHTRWHMQMHLKSHQKEGLILEENRNAVMAMVMQNARKIPKGPPNPHLPPPPPPPPPPTAPTTPPPQLSHPPDERSRICNICGEVFQHFYYLEEHLKTHGNKIAFEDLDKEEEKKYTCQICSKSFKLHYYLKLHSFTHTKEKPFICQQCGKGFITKGKLKRHLETHQGLKKYQCHICCKFFTRPSYMRIHVRTIHGTQDYNFRDYGVGVPLGLGGPLGQITDNI